MSSGARFSANAFRYIEIRLARGWVAVLGRSGRPERWTCNCAIGEP
jgi:hypothetical protein